MNEKATIHRYLADDLESDGIPEGTLVACIDGDCDEDKKAICFSLPDLRDPVCNAYLADLGPVLATIEVAPRGIEPYGFAPAGSSDVLPAIVRAEERERSDAQLMADPRLVEAIRTLRAAGVTVEMFETLLARADVVDDGDDS